MSGGAVEECAHDIYHTTAITHVCGHQRGIARHHAAVLSGFGDGHMLSHRLLRVVESVWLGFCCLSGFAVFEPGSCMEAWLQALLL
jgi:hypothetical protein